jgi:hypothetical protein
MEQTQSIVDGNRRPQLIIDDINIPKKNQAQVRQAAR